MSNVDWESKDRYDDSVEDHDAHAKTCGVCELYYVREKSEKLRFEHHRIIISYMLTAVAGLIIGYGIIAPAIFFWL